MGGLKDARWGHHWVTVPIIVPYETESGAEGKGDTPSRCPAPFRCHLGISLARSSADRANVGFLSKLFLSRV